MASEQLQAKEQLKQQVAQDSVVTARPQPESPDSPTPPPTVSYVVEALGSTSRQTRNARIRSLLALAVLTVVAAGAVVAGMVANNDAFWTGVSVVFYTALAGVITYAANELGIVSKMTGLLRAALKSEGSAAAEETFTQAAPSRSEIAFELGEAFRKKEQLTEAENAFLVAAKDGHAEAQYALSQLYAGRGDLANAEPWLLKASAADHPEASYLLGRLHGDQSVAINEETYKEMAFDGSAVAAYVLGRSVAERGEQHKTDRLPLPERELKRRREAKRRPRMRRREEV